MRAEWPPFSALPGLGEWGGGGGGRGGGGNLVVIVVRVFEPVFRKLHQSYTWPFETTDPFIH